MRPRRPRTKPCSRALRWRWPRPIRTSTRSSSPWRCRPPLPEPVAEVAAPIAAELPEPIARSRAAPVAEEPAEEAPIAMESLARLTNAIAEAAAEVMEQPAPAMAPTATFAAAPTATLPMPSPLPEASLGATILASGILQSPAPRQRSPGPAPPHDPSREDRVLLLRKRSPSWPGLTPAIHAHLRLRRGVDARDKPGHDDQHWDAHMHPQSRHCERSEAIQTAAAERLWIASLRSLMTESTATTEALACACLPMETTLTLWRPVRPKELELIQQTGMRAFPAAALPDQPIFYPVLTEDYAIKITRDWNVQASGSGFVTRCGQARLHRRKYDVQEAGGRSHLEYWIPGRRPRCLQCRDRRPDRGRAKFPLARDVLAEATRPASSQAQNFATIGPPSGSSREPLPDPPPA